MYKEIKADIELKLLGKLQANCVIPSDAANNPRAVGDLVQNASAKLLVNCFRPNLVTDFKVAPTLRSMEDVSFSDSKGNYYFVDIKTHNVSTKFNMPNLTSVRSLAKFYEKDTNNFCILIIEYRVTNVTGRENKVEFKEVTFNLIEHLSWDCLTIGALGWGQIQIANSKNVVVSLKQKRKDWMLELCKRLEAFYPKEIKKIEEKRIGFFKGVESVWKNK